MANSLPSGDNDCPTLEDDYYSILNLDKNATSEDITYSYRRFSRLYHPDKHNDPEKKVQAEVLFNKTKKAYEVLIDPHKRAIYDTVGIKGVQTDGWLIVERTKTPQEIKEEYEQLVKEREERRLQQQTNPKGVLVVHINATDVFESYEEDYSFPTVEISSMSLSQSVEAPLNTSDTFSLNGNLIAQNGNGSGNIGCTFRKITSSKGWMELGLGAGNGFMFTVKGFRHFTTKSFGSLQGTLNFTPMGIAPGVQAVIGRQLTKHVGGFITWKGGNASSIKTTVAWNSSEGHSLTTDIQFGVRGNLISLNYRHKISEDTRLKSSVKFGVNGAVLEYGCEKKLSQISEVGATMAIGVPQGVTLKLRLNRANQSYLFPVLLSEELMPSAIFYGTMAPVVGWYILKLFVIDPYNERQKQKLKEENAAKLAERRKEALVAVNLMQEMYTRIKQQEENKKGLVIIQAYYGAPEEINNVDGTPTENQRVFDVTVQLQCLVNDSRLVLPKRSKSNLSGFYDPCLGEEKCLLINYSYRGVVYSLTIKDEEMLRIPNER